MNKKTIIRTICPLLIAALCAGCAKSADVPELLEPVSRSDLYRPASVGKIENVKALTASVVPTQYAQFFTEETTIESFAVEVGDTVAEGDVLAYVDIGLAQEQLDALNTQLMLEEESFRISGLINDCRVQEMSGLKALLTAEEDADGTLADSYDVQIATLKEDLRYDTLLHEYRVQKLEQSIAAFEEIVAVGELRASHAGMVTYVAGISDSSSNLIASAYQNIAVVSDCSDCYLELDEITVKTYEYEAYEGKYVMVDGEKYPVTEIPYSSEELIAANAAKDYPYMRMTLPEGVELELGTRYLVYFTASDADEVLMVGNDSLYTDGEESFVYVKTEEGEREKRTVTVGASDDLYTEITSGLSEGELVYYASQDSPPDVYETQTVTLTDFVMEVSVFPDGLAVMPAGELSYWKTVERAAIQIKELAGGIHYNYDAPASGTITWITEHVDGDSVEEGELIYCMDTGIATAALTEQEYKIASENRSYEKALLSYEEQEKALLESGADAVTLACETKIISYQKELLEITHEASLSALEEEYQKMQEGNDGTGLVYVYAEESGILSFFKEDGAVSGTRGIAEGDYILEGQTVFYITTSPPDQLCLYSAQGGGYVDSLYYNKKVIATSDSYNAIKAPILEDTTITANIGQTVYVTNMEGEIYPLTVTGIGGGYVCNSRVYLTQIDGKWVISHTAGNPNCYFWAQDEGDLLENYDSVTTAWDFLRMENALVVPENCVYQGKDASNNTVNYVWLVVDGELVKQYISISEYYISLNNFDTYSVYFLVFSGLSEGDVVAYEKE